MYERKKFDDMFYGETSPILQVMPKFTSKKVYSGEVYTDEVLKKEIKNGAMVHFWATWCAPCEAELPIFIKLAKKFESMDVKFVLLAVQDDNKSIKKFLKRFKEMPKNIEIVHDQKGDSMPIFGTVKVPETFLFNSLGRNLNKFVGPQDWDHPNYYNRIKSLLGL